MNWITNKDEKSRQANITKKHSMSQYPRRTTITRKVYHSNVHRNPTVAGECSAHRCRASEATSPCPTRRQVDRARSPPRSRSRRGSTSSSYHTSSGTAAAPRGTSTCPRLLALSLLPLAKARETLMRTMRTMCLSRRLPRVPQTSVPRRLRCVGSACSRTPWRTSGREGPAQ